MSPRRAKLWRLSVGQRPFTVSVCERTPGGRLYVRLWHPEKGYQPYRSLGHRDRGRAAQYARDLYEKLRVGVVSARSSVLTLGLLFDLWRADTYPAGVDAKKRGHGAKKEDDRRIDLFSRLWGAEISATKITLAHWDRLRAQRLSGAVDARGRAVAPKNRQPVGAAAVAHDGRFIRAVYYWAMRTRGAENVPLLSYNPFAAPREGARSAFSLPKNPTPNRPRTSDERFAAIREAARFIYSPATKDTPNARRVPTAERTYNRSTVRKPMMRWMAPSYLPALLDLAWETGRRRGAILDLRYSDIVREKGQIVAIRWRPTKRAIGPDVIPVSPRARQALERVLAMRPGIGNKPLFPSMRDPQTPIHRKVVDEWLLKAEDLAGVGHQPGGLWHALRRSWATRRKHHPDVDVARAGGWRDLATLKASYQGSDDETLVAVINEPAQLVERVGGQS